MKHITTILLIFLSVQVFCQNYNGSFQYKGENATLIIQLNQTGNKVQGTLKSTTGSVFQIEGEVQENVAMGYCSNQDGTSFFEAYLEGNQLTFGLIEPDENNIPNYDKAQYIPFTKTDNSTFDNSQQIGKNKSNNSTKTTTNSPQNIESKKGTSSISANEVGNPMWGLKLVPPAGWVHQINDEGIILGHNTIAGMIMIFPHQSKTMQAIQSDMQQGIHEEGNSLNMDSGTLKSAGNQVMVANYTGVMNGTQVKARGFGVLSPYGGGAFILAVSTPEMLTNDLINAGKQTVKNLTFFKPNVDVELVKLFAGRWTTITKNSRTSFCLCEDGSFVENYESSYSGNDANAVGGVWGTANNSQSSGRWTYKGDRMGGQFIITLNNGNTVYYNYKRNGNKLNELYINNTLYGRYDDL
ncbi:MAG: hypothetical protein JXB49_37810 [Bacteroidales bacterium]|nr:hypothetical protein [Bacteroidales bacterium]MBN2747529.1 hypothetical protein [Bacteroidales bacterium]